MTDAIAQLFKNNRDWVDCVNAEDPTFFTRLANQQAPEYLWIGCSDSRVPANQILGLAPGEVFVHRNIANAILAQRSERAVRAPVRRGGAQGAPHHRGGPLRLRRRQGGAQARARGLADNWLRHVQDVADKHAAYLGTVLREDDAHTRLCELNVIEQVNNVCQTTVLQDAWDRGQAVTVHGWVYGVSDGCCATSAWPPAATRNCKNNWPRPIASTATPRRPRSADFQDSTNRYSGDNHARPDRHRIRRPHAHGRVPERVEQPDGAAARRRGHPRRRGARRPETEQVQEVVFGCVLPAGQGRRRRARPRSAPGCRWTWPVPRSTRCADRACARR